MKFILAAYLTLLPCLLSHGAAERKPQLTPDETEAELAPEENDTVIAGPVPMYRAKNVPNIFRGMTSATPAGQRLQKAIEKIPGKNVSVGVIAEVVQTGEILAEKNADDQLIPASVNKVITAYTALKKLRPTSTFKTTLKTTGPIRNGVLIGDLYIRGSGDPSLVSERMWMLVNDFMRWGVTTISGNLVCDATYFDLERTPDSRPKYLTDQAYNAPVGALSFNFNTTTIYVKPNEIVGQPPVVYTDPQNSYIDIVNQATTGKSGSKNSLAVTRTKFIEGDIGDTVLLRGALPSNHKEVRFYRNIVNPTLYTAHMFKNFLEQRGIKLQGNVIEGTVPSNARTLVDFESLPMWQVVWGMNKFSNNFTADQLMKRIGAEAWGPPGTLQKGLTAVGDALEDIGIPRNSYRITDGSGLTRNTHISARQLLRVLHSAYHDFSISSEFMASLGIAGEDGTLRNRFPSSTATSVLRGKTGTLDGVASLAGFVPSADGELIAFVILLNDPKNYHGRMTGWVDQIALAISKFSRK